MTTRSITRLLAATAMTAAIGWGGTASAGTIDLQYQNFSQADLGDARTALDNFINPNKWSLTEDFGVGDLGGDGQEAVSGGLDTKVGTFKRGPDAVDGDTGGACIGDCDQLYVLNKSGSPGSPFSGRYDTSADDTANDGSGNWLDSNDVSEVVWSADLDDLDNPSPDKISRMAVLLTDVEDVGADFKITLEDTTNFDDELDVTGGGDGSVTLVTARFRDFVPPISSFTATFKNEGGNADGDGFGIDDASIAAPIPGTVALLGAGLIGLGVVARRRHAA